VTPLRHGCASSSSFHRPGETCSTEPLTEIRAKGRLISVFLKLMRPSSISIFSKRLAMVGARLGPYTGEVAAPVRLAGGSQSSKFQRPSLFLTRVRLG